MKRNVFVLLRGLARESGHWDRMPQVLSAAMGTSIGGSEIILLDMPGTGEFNGETSPTLLSKYVTIMRQRLIGMLGGSTAYDEIIASGGMHFIGVSLGGMIGVQWSVAHSKEVCSLTLINTSLARFSLPWKRMKSSASQTLFVDVGREKDPHKREELLVNLVTHDRSRRSLLIENWAKIMRLRPVLPINFGRQLTAGFLFRGPKTIQVPTLVLVSTTDQLVHPDCSRVLRKKWGVNLYEHSWAGHDLICDDPEWVAKKVKLFLCEKNLLESERDDESIN